MFGIGLVKPLFYEIFLFYTYKFIEVITALFPDPRG